MPAKIDIDRRLQVAVQGYWQARAENSSRQRDQGKLDAGTRGEVTGGAQMAGLEGLIADLLSEAGIPKLDIRTRQALELPGYFRATKKWDLVVCSQGRLVLAMEFKSQAGKSIGNNVNNRSEEAVGSAKDLWTVYREGRLGTGGPTPFLGYLFLLEDRESVHRPVANKEPHFKVDPVFRASGTGRAAGITYAQRYEWLCRRLVLERLYSAACFLTATNGRPTRIAQLAEDLTFNRLVAALRGHAVSFLGTRNA